MLATRSRKQTLKTNRKPSSLRYWMLRVLEECENVARGFEPDPVHDLRVSLRRCRSLADGLIAMDPDREWKSMKKAGKKLFQSLGALRDVQIMIEWVEKLDFANAARTPPSVLPNTQPNFEDGSAGDSLEHPSTAAAHNLLQLLRAREGEQKQQARAALDAFDAKQWRRWSDTLPRRAARIRPGSAVFKHLALERWTAARHLHLRAMRTRSPLALHTLRIAIKRFRYVVENFLPEEHKLWGSELKRMQDLLGEVHDLDILWATAVDCRIFGDEFSRNLWRERIAEEREKRIGEYRSRTTGPDSLWNTWRAGLPKGKKIEQIATARMKVWAKVLDPDFAHSERVAKLATELYDALDASGLLGASRNGSSNGAGDGARASLYLGALLHDVGKSVAIKGHHKHSMELIQRHGTPLGWSAENMRRAALLARFHCGTLPSHNHKALRDLLSDEQRMMIRLGAILRLANALDIAHDGRVRRIKIDNIRAARRGNGFLRKSAGLGRHEPLVIAAEGYVDRSPTAQAVAAERYLLETVLKRPVILKAAQAPRQRHSVVRVHA
jgi:CHAD domain-containing protein/HD superfamily phosphodiesterase